MKGKADLEEGRYDRAVIELNAAWQGGKDPKALLLLARTIELQGRREMAARTYDEWLATGAGEPNEREEVKVRVANLRGVASAPAKATLPLPRMDIPSGPPDARAHALFKQGRADYDAGSYDLAITELDESYALSKKAPLLVVLARAYELKGDRAGAIARLEQYLATGATEDRDVVTAKLELLKKQK